MAYALVGAVGAVTTGTLNNAITPAWGTGANRTAGDLLICWCYQSGSAGNIATPSGWSVAIQSSTVGGPCVNIFYKIAAGGDAAPTLGGLTGSVLSGQLAEFSGNLATSPLDQTGSNAASSNPITADTGVVDTQVGELLLFGGTASLSPTGVSSLSFTSNNASSITAAGSNNGVSTTPHWAFAYALATTSNSVSTTVTETAAGGSITGMNVCGATFLIPTVAGPAGKSLNLTQAVKMASLF